MSRVKRAQAQRTKQLKHARKCSAIVDIIGKELRTQKLRKKKRCIKTHCTQ